MNKKKYNVIRLSTALLLLIFTANGITPLTWAIVWSSDTQLTFDSEAWDKSSSIVQVANGSIWVVWQSDRIGVQYDLYYKTSGDYGLTWSSDTRLTAHSSSDIKPSIIQAVDGSIWVVWSSYRTGDYEIFYKTSGDYGLTWSPETRLTTDSSRDMSPSIIQDTSGAIWVVWQRDAAGVFDIYYKTSPDYGLTWSSDIQLTADPGWDLAPSITKTWNGSIWVVWSSYRTGDYEIFYKTSGDYGLTWSSDIQLTTDLDFDESPSIVQAVDGSIWVVWQSDRAGTQYDIYYRTSPDYGLTWSSDIQLTTHSKDDEGPSITNTDKGKMWVTWSSTRTFDYEIFYKTSDLIPIHDVAITDITPSSTDVTGGEAITISVTAENQGTQTETFDVNCYANSTLIGSQTITLANGTSTTLPFEWTTPFPTATYTISATASTIPGETLPNTVDNTFNDGTVNVTRPPIQGDIDGDGDVDIDDLYYILIAYGMTIEDAMATYGVPPTTDIDNDGTIDLDDLYYVLRDFGES